MIIVYGMKSCPDCAYVEDQIADNSDFKLVDIGDDVHNLKAFLRLRDTSSVFDEVKQSGSIGIPCFVLPDGSLTLVPEKVGLRSRPAEGAACRLDGTGC